MKNHVSTSVLLLAGLLLVSPGTLTAGEADSGSEASVEKTDKIRNLQEIAIRAMRNDREEKARRAIEKVIQKIGSTREEVKHNDVYPSRDEAKKLMQKTVNLLVKKEEQLDLARQYIRAFLEKKYIGRLLISGESSRTSIRKAFKKQREALYKIVRSNYRYRALIETETVFDIIRKRVKQERAEVRDFIHLARETKQLDLRREGTYSKQQLKPYRDLLRKGIERYPDKPRLLSRLGDVYYLMKNYVNAAETYRKVMDTSYGKRRDRRFRTKHSVDHEDRRRWAGPFITSSTAPFQKLAVVLDRMGRTEEARNVIMRRVDKGNRRYRLVVARALERIGQLEDAVSVLSEPYGALSRTLENEDQKEPKVFWWFSLRLYNYLRMLDRPAEAYFIGQHAVRTLDQENVRGAEGKMLQSLEEDIKTLGRNLGVHRLELNVHKEFLNAPRPDLNEQKKKKITRLIDQLGKESFQKRKQVVHKLKKFGYTAIPVLRKHRNHDNPEVRHQVNHLLKTYALRHSRKKFREKYGLNEQQ